MSRILIESALFSVIESILESRKNNAGVHTLGSDSRLLPTLKDHFTQIYIMSTTKVPFEVIEEVSDYLESFESADDALKVAQQFADDQPFVMSYLMARAEDLKSDDTAELLLYIGNVIYLSAKKVTPSLGTMDAKTIDAAEETFLAQMKAISQMSEEEALSGYEPIFSAQPDLSTYLIGWVEQLSEDGEDEESINSLYSVLQVLVNAFDLLMSKTD